VHDDPVAVLQVAVDAVLDLAVRAPDRFVLVEDLLPRVVVADAVVDDEGDLMNARTAWHRLLQVSRLVLRELDRRLDDENRISVNEFDVLITLDNAPDRRLRMTELADAVLLLLFSGGLTRLAGRLESRGLVARRQDPSDARSFHATLTPAGAERLAEARATHDAVIAELLESKLTGARVGALARGLGRVIAENG
jgi:DNA-binding MarR family transcriptional regulator